MLRSIVFFSVGGLFTGVFANSVRKRPFFYQPHRVAISVAIGTLLGYWMHRYEENLEASIEQIMKDHPRAPPLRELVPPEIPVPDKTAE